MDNANVVFTVEGLGEFSAKERFNQVDKLNLEFLIDEILGGAENRIKFSGNQLRLQGELSIDDDFNDWDNDRRKKKIIELVTSADVNIRRKVLAWRTICSNMNTAYGLAELETVLTKIPAGIIIRELDDDKYKAVWEAYIKAVEPFRPKKKSVKKSDADTESSDVSTDGIVGDEESSPGSGGSKDTVQAEISASDN